MSIFGIVASHSTRDLVQVLNQFRLHTVAAVVAAASIVTVCDSGVFFSNRKGAAPSHYEGQEFQRSALAIVYTPRSHSTSRRSASSNTKQEE